MNPIRDPAGNPIPDLSAVVNPAEAERLAEARKAHEEGLRRVEELRRDAERAFAERRAKRGRASTSATDAAVRAQKLIDRVAAVLGMPLDEEPDEEPGEVVTEDPFPFERRTADALESIASTAAALLEVGRREALQREHLVTIADRLNGGGPQPTPPAPVELTEDEKREEAEWRAKQKAAAMRREARLEQEWQLRLAFDQHQTTQARALDRIAEVLEFGKAQRTAVDVMQATLRRSIEEMQNQWNTDLRTVHALVSSIRADARQFVAPTQEVENEFVGRLNRIDAAIERTVESLLAFKRANLGG
jgi:hypothetical protein